MRKIADLNSQIAKAKLDLKYQDIFAPASGTIFELKASNLGFVVNPSEPILQIVPDRTLVAKVFVTNRDIGFIKTGMTADVRLDTFPFSEYGDVKGKIIAIDEILVTWQPGSPPDPEVEREQFDRCFRQIAALPATEGMSEAQLQQIVTRTVKLQQFQAETWGDRVGSYYLVRKAQIDRVVFSIVQVEEVDIAQELYFRVRSGEASFGDVAREYSQGIAANDGGKLGPLPMANLPPAIALA